MWRLAHAHGTLLALLNISYGIISDPNSINGGQQLRFKGACWLPDWLIPGGFFLAGLFAYESTPGLGTLLVPSGASPVSSLASSWLPAAVKHNEKLAAHAKNSPPLELYRPA